MHGIAILTQFADRPQEWGLDAVLLTGYRKSKLHNLTNREQPRRLIRYLLFQQRRLPRQRSAFDVKMLQ